MTGPFTTQRIAYGPPNSNGTRTLWFQRTATSYRQTKPYNLPLPFMSDQKAILGLTSSDPSSTAQFESCWPMRRDGWDVVLNTASFDSYNKAYNKFIGNLKTAQAELGAAIAEHKQSLRMLADRSLQLANFVIALKRLRFGDASKALGLTKVHVPKSKRFADAVLEYRFGWAPLAGDVENAMKTLVSGLPAFRVHGKGIVRGVINSAYRVSSPGSTPVVTHTDNVTWSSGHHITARVWAINPNQALANQLGLVNPAFAAWEIVPWSFVLDYFVNVGDWLNGFTDLYGYDLADENWTWRAVASASESHVWIFPVTPKDNGAANWTSYRYVVDREVGPLGGPTLAVKPAWRLSPTRALTSVSLLLQQLHR